MKRCPVCGETYDDKVDFCFSDGAPLESVDGSGDPTALPEPKPSQAETPASAAEPKGKRPRRGMFGRPSVADMLSVAEPGVVPPVGGVRVKADAQPEPAQEDAVVRRKVDLPDISDHPTEIREAGSFADAVTFVDEPERSASPPVIEDDSAVTEISEPDAVVEAAEVPAASVPSLAMPVSAAAVDVPDPSSGKDEPTDAPPGFEAEVTALDDSWFGDGMEDEETQPEIAVPPPVVEEDPPEDDAFDDVGFVDDSWSADASGGDTWESGPSASQDVPIPKKMVIGGVAVLAAAVLLTVALSGDDESPPSTPVAQVEAAPEPPPPPPPPPAPAEPEPEVEEPLAEAEAEAEVAEVAVPDEPEPVAVTPPPATRPAPPPPAKAKAAKATRAAKASKARRNKAAPAPADAGRSPWTGTPAAAPAPAPASTSNPWGAPTETPSRGRLTITTDPSDATIYVGDRRIGKSPTQTEVNYGTHNIRVELADHRSTSRMVNVQASEVSVPFRLELANAVGRCSLLGNPGSAVVMNGRSVGALPVTVDCQSGTYGFKVTPPGGESFQVSRTVNIARAGESTTIFLAP